jgi:hypothetical protein
MNLTGRGLAFAAVALAAQACQQGGGDGARGPLTGRWAMFDFEDPVTVDLRESGAELQGEGCCGGFDDQSTALQCCGVLQGYAAAGHATFGFSFDSVGEHHDYSTSVFVSADGQRMAGTFSQSGWPVTWIRIGATDTDFFSSTLAPEPIPTPASGRFALTLSDAPAPGSDFSAQTPLTLVLDTHFVSGDLGSFWSGEMSWNAAEQTLLVGPVPETAPGLPVALRLRFDGTGLASVEATMAAGLRYHFQATAAPL